MKRNKTPGAFKPSPSPLPWVTNPREQPAVKDAEGYEVAAIYGDATSPGRDAANAALVVKAVNGHGKLVEFVKSFAAPTGPKIYRDMDWTDLFEILESLNKEAREVLRAVGEA